MEITIWWDAQNNPTRPWCYEITYFHEYRVGECASLEECWREFESFIVKGCLEDRVVGEEITQDNQPQTRH